MNKRTIQKKLINIVDEVFNPENKITKNTEFSTFDLTVENKVKFAGLVEEVFEVQFTVDEMNKLVEGTICDLVEFIYLFLLPFED